MSVCLSVSMSAWNNSGPLGRIFVNFVFEYVFKKSVGKFKVH